MAITMEVELISLRTILILHLLTTLSLNSIHGDGVIQEAHHDHHLSHIHHHQMDPSVLVFFLLNDLKKGKSMQIYFPNRDNIIPSSSSPVPSSSSSSSVIILTKQEADKIPFSSKQLPQLLQRFSFSIGSPQAIAMEDALSQCEMKPIKGEIKFCATSIESMLDFAREIFHGHGHAHVEALSTTHLTPLKKSGIQRYTITENPFQIWAPKMVACHTMPYPYTVFYCHYQESESKVYRVHLVDEENGDEVEAIAVCHMDTSEWSSKHVSFSLLGIKPGESPVCHFFPADHLVLVPDSSTQFTAAA